MTGLVRLYGSEEGEYADERLKEFLNIMRTVRNHYK